MSTFLPLRIYSLDAERAARLPELDAHVDRCAAAGFTHLILPAAPAMEALGLPAPDVPAAVAACARRSIRLLLDVEITPPETPADGTEATDQDDEPPDPRRPIGALARRRPRASPQETAQGTLAAWRQRLAEWQQSGAAGFCCRNLAALPPAAWTALIDDAKQEDADILLLAWTPGCTPEQIDALAGCGFDAAFSSAAWWDYRAGWLAEEWARLAAVAPPIAFPDDADGSALHRFTDPQDDAAVRRARLRALRLAAGVGCGLLVPSGFLDDDDLRDAAAEACATVASIARLLPATRMTLLEMVTMGHGNDDEATAVLRHAAGSRAADEGILVLANPSLERPATFDTGRHGERLRGLTMLERLLPADEERDAGDALDEGTIRLAPGEVQLFRARRAKPVTLPANRGRRAIDAATKLPRIAIEAVSPAVDGGAFPVKRVVGECVDVEADVFADGHDRLGVALRWRAVDEAAWQEV
ncbi:MAG: maltotransferase domain-containing protein, partial [Burkholderiaceae bacterium]